MKKIIFITIILAIVFLFSSCKYNNRTENELNSEPISDNVVINSEPFSLSESVSQIDIEDYTSEYVEPNCKIVYKLSDVLTYFETEKGYTSDKKYNEDNQVNSVTTKNKDGDTVGVIDVKYKDDSTVATASIYENGKSIGKKIVFSFTPDGNLNLVAIANSQTSIDLYVYDGDGTPKYYVNSDNFSALMTNVVMSGISGMFS